MSTLTKRISFTAVTLSSTGLMLAALGGCSDEPEPQAVAPAPVRTVRAAPPPAPPKLKTIEELKAELGIDERVIVPEAKAPPTEAERVALLEFFDGFARGDAETLGSMLPLLDRLELEALVESGAWAETTNAIREIRIETGNGPFEERCALAIFDVDGGGFQPQLWYYKTEAGDATFEAVATPPDMINKLHGVDRIALWHEILEKEMALASEPDEEVAFQVNLSGDDEDPAGGTPGAAPGPSPGTPTPGGDPYGRRPPPPGGPRKPPGPG